MKSLSKIIKASKIIGKYKIKNHQKSLSLQSAAKDNSAEEQMDKREEDDNKAAANKSTNKNNTKKAEAKAAEIIAEAEKKAAQIVAEAEAEKEELNSKKEEIFSKIKEEAEAEALKSAQAKVENRAAEFLETVESFNAEIEKQKIESKKDLINLAVKIAAIIIDVKLEEDPEIINNIVSSMLAKIDESHSNITVKIHPDLIPYLEKNDLFNRLEDKNLNFKGDYELEKGDCVVESSLGGKEGSIADKIELIRDELLREVELSV